MAALLDREQLGAWDRPRDMLGDSDRDEVSFASNDQGRNPQATQLREQIVAGRLPGVAHKLVFDRSRLEDALIALPDECGFHRYHQPLVVLRPSQRRFE